MHIKKDVQILVDMWTEAGEVCNIRHFLSVVQIHPGSVFALCLDTTDAPCMMLLGKTHFLFKWETRPYTDIMHKP